MVVVLEVTLPARLIEPALGRRIWLWPPVKSLAINVTFPPAPAVALVLIKLTATLPPLPSRIMLPAPVWNCALEMVNALMNGA